MGCEVRSKDQRIIECFPCFVHFFGSKNLLGSCRDRIMYLMMICLDFKKNVSSYCKVCTQCIMHEELMQNSAIVDCNLLKLIGFCLFGSNSILFLNP